MCPDPATTAGSGASRAQENELILKHIRQIHLDSRGTYGSLATHAGELDSTWRQVAAGLTESTNGTTGENEVRLESPRR
jgi:hypothetical protein